MKVAASAQVMVVSFGVASKVGAGAGSMVMICCSLMGLPQVSVSDQVTVMVPPH
jgi:hypothetical protein